MSVAPTGPSGPDPTSWFMPEATPTPTPTPTPQPTPAPSRSGGPGGPMSVLSQLQSVKGRWPAFAAFADNDRQLVDFARQLSRDGRLGADEVIALVRSAKDFQAITDAERKVLHDALHGEYGTVDPEARKALAEFLGLEDPIARAERLAEERDRAAATKLAGVLDRASQLKQYQPGYESWKDGTPKTFCNILARDVLEGDNPDAFDFYMGTLVDDYRYDVSAILPDTGSILNTPIPVIYDRAAQAARDGKITELTPAEAQAMANKGIPVWIVSKKYNHEAIVYPNLDEPFDPAKGVKIGQAGAFNVSDVYISDPRSWGGWHTDPEIKYYMFPPKAGSPGPS